MCEICNKYPCNYKCPNYIPPKTKIKCFICEEGIYNGERYLDNENGEYLHEDCVDCLDADQLINWLGFTYKEMDDYNLRKDS